MTAFASKYAVLSEADFVRFCCPADAPDAFRFLPASHSRRGSFGMLHRNRRSDHERGCQRADVLAAPTLPIAGDVEGALELWRRAFELTVLDRAGRRAEGSAGEHRRSIPEYYERLSAAIAGQASTGR